MKFPRVVILLPLFLALTLRAGTLEVTVQDKSGAMAADAVVYAQRKGAPSASVKRQTLVDQRDKQFIPYVTAVQVGTAISFPNSDKIRHHVYSLSPAKRFELPLYAGVPAAPVVFDKAGFVTLGCNIHDWMIAYVAVVATPYFKVTGGEGRATLQGLPAGDYTVRAWQPSLRGMPEQFAQLISVAPNETKQLRFTLDLKPDFRVGRRGLSTGDYP